MRFFNYFMILSVALIFTGKMNGQTVTYTDAESLFSDEQKKVLDKAETFIKKGDKLIKDANAIDAKNEKKKKKEKKYEKKTWEAKKFRIDAEKNYLKAYQDAITVYSEIVASSDYFDAADERKAHSLNDAAQEALTESESKMSNYDKMAGDDGALKKLSSSSLNTAINSARNLKEDALEKEKEALDIILSQGLKREAVLKDQEAWETAQEINTIASYQNYVDEFPRGKYVSDARQMIQRLQDEEKKRKEFEEGNYIFMVQIAASKVALSQGKLASIYKNTKDIQKVKAEGYFKYRVGNFKNYAEAANFRDQLWKKGVPDAFVVVFDKSGNQIEVLENMKH